MQVTRRGRHDSIFAVSALASPYSESPEPDRAPTAPVSRWGQRIEAAVAVLLFAFPLFAISVESWVSSIYYLLAIVGLGALRRPQPPLSRTEKRFFGVIVFYLVTTIVANSLSGWTRASVGWYEADLRFLLAIPIYLYLRTRPRVCEWLLRGIPFAALGSGGYVLWQTFALDTRVEGPYGPIFAGDICALLAVLSLAALSFRLYPRIIGVALHVPAFALASAGALFSGTRGAWVALALALPLLGWMALRTVTDRRRRYLLLGGMVLGIIALSSAVVLLQPDMTSERLALAVKQGEQFLEQQDEPEFGSRRLGSIGTRLEQWRIGLLVAAEHPLFGLGVGNVRPELEARVEAGEAHPAVLAPSAGTRRGVHLHSAYMDALVFKGVPGLLALLCVLGFPLWLAMSRGHRGTPAANFIAVHVLMVAIFALTEDPFIRNNFTSIFLMMLVCGLALLHSERSAVR